MNVYMYVCLKYVYIMICIVNTWASRPAARMLKFVCEDDGTYLEENTCITICMESERATLCFDVYP
jgi:hypothetical protein